MANILFISEKKLKSESYINDNVGNEFILPAILSAQDMKLQPLLGCSLYAKLKSDVAGQGPAGKYKILMDDYIKPFLIYAVMADIQVPLAFKMRQNGIVQANNDYTYNQGKTDVDALKRYYEDKMNWYGFRMTDYLNNNKQDIPEYCDNSCGCKSDLRQGFDSGIYLGK